MPEHGDYDQESHRWFCSYWMAADEWNDIHDYAPQAMEEQEAKSQEEGNNNNSSSGGGN